MIQKSVEVIGSVLCIAVHEYELPSLSLSSQCCIVVVSMVRMRESQSQVPSFVSPAVDYSSEIMTIKRIGLPTLCKLFWCQLSTPVYCQCPVI